MATFRGSGTPGTGDNFPTEQDLQDAVTAAELAETNAQASESAASTSEGNAATSETNSAASAAAAASSATDAETAQTAAELAETNAETAETNAETAETGALAAQTAAEAALDEFDDLYLGTKASDPTLDNDGDALQTGALYFNSTNDVLRVYDGTNWGDAGQATANFTEWTATAGQTAFTGTDDKAKLLSYKAGFLMVFQNGTLLDPDDYTATDGSTVTLGTAATGGDILNFVGYGTFDVANTYTKAEVDAFKRRPNILNNGDFQVWQRGTSFTLAAGSNTSVADRWKFAFAGVAAAIASKDTDVPTGLVGSSLKVDVTTADTSIAAGDYALLMYNQEESPWSALRWGTSTPSDLAVSFWVKSPKVGAHCVSFRDASNSVHYVATYTVASANVWQKIAFIVPGTSTGTWGVGTAAGVQIRFPLMAGSAGFAPADNVWGAGSYYSSSSQVNCVDSAVNNFLIKEVKMEAGPEVTPYIAIPLANELALCQRYFQKSFKQSDAPAELATNQSTSGTVIGSTQIRVFHKFATTMRSTPNLTFYKSSSGASSGCWSYWNAAVVNSTATTTVSAETSDANFICDLAVTGRSLGDTYQVMGGWSADAEL